MSVSAGGGVAAGRFTGQPLFTTTSVVRDRAIYATRQLAKRQITWLRSMPQRVVLACDAPGLEDRAMPLVHAMLQGRS